MDAPTNPHAVTSGAVVSISGAFSNHPPHPGATPVSADGRVMIRGDFSSMQTPARPPKKARSTSPIGGSDA